MEAKKILKQRIDFQILMKNAGYLWSYPRFKVRFCRFCRFEIALDREDMESMPHSLKKYKLFSQFLLLKWTRNSKKSFTRDPAKVC